MKVQNRIYPSGKDRPYDCDECLMTFTTFREWKTHSIREHVRTKEYEVSLLKSQFLSLTAATKDRSLSL